MQERVKATENIEVHWHSQVDEVLGNDKEGVTAIRVLNNKTNTKTDIPAAGLFFGDWPYSEHWIPQRTAEAKRKRLHPVDQAVSC